DASEERRGGLPFRARLAHLPGTVELTAVAHPAHAADDSGGDALGVGGEDLHGDHPAHGVADEPRFGDVQVVHQAEDIVGHLLAVVAFVGGFVGLAVAAAVEGN